ncbi:MAG: helix-turn-helix transcriptional regulator [Bacteroidota bacterium]
MPDRFSNAKMRNPFNEIRDDPADQREGVKEVQKRLRNILDSQLEMFPADVQTMMKHIHAHLFENALTVERIKRMSRHANNNIVTRFRVTVGMGVREYIVNQRLKAAASILCSTQVNIYFVASSVGYTEEAFSRLFKKTYGCTPSEYRRERKGTNGREK